MADQQQSRRMPNGAKTEAPLASVYKRRVGEEVKKLREFRITSGPQVAAFLDMSESSYSRMERGQGAFHARDLKRILEWLHELYPLPEGKADELMEMNRKARERGRYGPYLYSISPRMKRYVELEWGASKITGCYNDIVYGLLQTEEYINSLHRQYDDPSRARKHADLRRARLEIFDRTEFVPQFHFVQGEAALRTLVGGKDVMRRQIEHIAAMAERPNVTIQILRLEAGYPFVNLTLLEFDAGATPCWVSDSWATTNFIEKVSSVHQSEDRLERIKHLASPAEDTPGILEEITNAL